MKLTNDINAMPIMGTVTSKLQLTIPKAIAERVGIKPRTKVLFSCDDTHLYMQSMRSVVEQAAGSLAKAVGQ